MFYEVIKYEGCQRANPHNHQKTAIVAPLITRQLWTKRPQDQKDVKFLVELAENSFHLCFFEDIQQTSLMLLSMEVVCRTADPCGILQMMAHLLAHLSQKEDA